MKANYYKRKCRCQLVLREDGTCPAPVPCPPADQHRRRRVTGQRLTPDEQRQPASSNEPT